MINENKICPSCANEIKIEARVCWHCGARFEISLKGYCENCHGIVEVDDNGLCCQCGGEIIDQHYISQVLDQQTKTPIPSVASPTLDKLNKPGSYIDRRLNPGEQIVRRTRMHWTKLLHVVLNLVLAFLFYMAAGSYANFLVNFAQRYGLPIKEQLLWVYVPLFLMLLFIINAVAEIIGLIFSELVVTNQRIVGRNGMLFVNISLGDIAEMRVFRGLFFIFDYGALLITRPDRKKLRLGAIPHPREFQQAVESQFPPGPRPEIQKLSIGKVLLIVFAILILTAGIFILIYHFSTGGLNR